MIKIIHVITGLAADGAERMMFNLITRMDRTRFDNTVVSLSGMGELGEPLRQEGIPVRALRLTRNAGGIFEFWRMQQFIERQKPDVVQTWMYHADLLGGLAARWAGIRRVLWGVHHFDADRSSTKWLTRMTAQVCAQFSKWLPERIVFCSEASLAAHGKLGYTAAKSEFIPNGFDTERFRPDPDQREAVRRELNIDADSPVVGIIGRYHAHKDYPTFLAAATLIAAADPNVTFVLCGRDVSQQNADFWEQVRAAGLEQRVRALGKRDDIARILTALDVVVSSSRTEAFPLAVGEAMAVAIPCVVTDVGDSKALVGNTGTVVPPTNPKALAEGVGRLLRSGLTTRQAKGAAARNRIQALYSLPVIVHRYEQLYLQVSQT